MKINLFFENAKLFYKVYEASVLDDIESIIDKRKILKNRIYKYKIVK